MIEQDTMIEQGIMSEQDIMSEQGSPGSVYLLIYFYIAN